MKRVECAARQVCIQIANDKDMEITAQPGVESVPIPRRWGANNDRPSASRLSVQPTDRDDARTARCADGLTLSMSRREAPRGCLSAQNDQGVASSRCRLRQVPREWVCDFEGITKIAKVAGNYLGDVA